jgi:hypothetical protein
MNEDFIFEDKCNYINGNKINENIIVMMKYDNYNYMQW